MSFAAIYKQLFWHWLKPRPHGSYWSWNRLQETCEQEGHDPVRENFTNHDYRKGTVGFLTKCRICDKWLEWDLTNNTCRSGDTEPRPTREIHLRAET